MRMVREVVAMRMSMVTFSTVHCNNLGSTDLNTNPVGHGSWLEV